MSRKDCLSLPEGNQHTMGLPNIGMSCFVNSVLNSLYFVPQFYSYFYSVKMNTKLTTLIKHFVTKYGKRGISAKRLHDIFDCFPQFPKGRMGSAVNFLQSLLQGLCEETMQRPSSSAMLRAYGTKSIQDLFTIVVEENKTCSMCEIQVTTASNTSVLSFNIAKKSYVYEEHKKKPIQTSLEASLDEFLSEQTDSPETAHLCRKCDRDLIHIIRKRIKHIGSVVVFYLQRYNSVDSKASIAIPKVLDMSKYIEGAGRYLLCSAVQHVGGLRGGHYRCFACASNGWMRIDDSRAEFLTDPENELSTSILFIYRLE